MHTTGMQSVREWLQDRFSSIELTEASQQSVVKAQRSSIITPDNIPGMTYNMLHTLIPHQSQDVQTDFR